MIRMRFIAAIILAALILGPTEARAEGGGALLAITVEGVIGPVSAEYIAQGIAKAGSGGYEALVVELDTPGGLDTSMREIVKAINESRVPVVVYVAPDGARAASAGAFITIAAHVAAMAPQTNIGAAHPVSVGEKMDEVMSAKATNDSAAYIRALAQERGRNPEWAELAVRNSVSVSAGEALALGVIDIIAPDMDSLLEDMDGMIVTTAIGNVTIATRGALVEREGMGLRHRLLDVITDPTVAYMLMMLGFYGLLYELMNPGAIFPGVIGGICLILAFYALQTLPVNYAGVLLIVLAVILFALETQIPSYGGLTIGGIIAMVLGSLMLFDREMPYLRVSLVVILTFTGLTALFMGVVLRLVVRAQRERPVSGVEGLIGEAGHVVADVPAGGEGMVLVHGERWRVHADEALAKGTGVEVVSVQGLMMKVRKREV